MLTHIFKHWQTSLAGVAGAVTEVVLNGRSGKQLALAVFVAILGLAAKDPKSGGGDIGQIK